MSDGHADQSLGEVAELALPRTGDEPLPSRQGMSHVQAIEAVTEQLRATARQYGGQAEVFGAAAKHYIRWMGVPAADAVQARLGCALAELHTEAGWACYDSGVDGRGYFTRALRLADEVGDGYGIGNAAWHAGASLVRSGHPDDALKAFQLGKFSLAGSPPGKSTPATFRTDDPRVPTISARLSISSAAACALLDYPDQARRALADAQESWQPCTVYERADKDLNAARVQADLGHLDTAEPFAATAARTFGEANRRDGATAIVVLAELHTDRGAVRVAAGPPRSHHRDEAQLRACLSAARTVGGGIGGPAQQRRSRAGPDGTAGSQFLTRYHKMRLLHSPGRRAIGLGERGQAGRGSQ